jgi:hypothetical protein
MASTNYNDINSPIFTRQKKDDAGPKKYITGVEDSPESTKEKPEPEYRIKSLNVIIPPEGIKQNSTFDFEGEMEKLGETCSKRIVVDVKTTYKDSKEYDDIIAPNIEVTFDNNKFKGICKKFWFNDFFLKDTEKAVDATFNLQLIAKGKTVEKEFLSEVYTFPMATKTVILKRGHYDDNGLKNYPDRCKKDGTNYIEGDAVLKLQQNLVRFRLLDKVATDGDFGENTENAVLAFQDYAKKPLRIKMKEGLVLKIDKITYNDEVDGIVGDKTQKEIDLWYQQEYVRPVPTLYFEDYDENWVQNGKGKKGTEEYHQSTPVTDLQKNLKKVGVFQKGNVDGHFFDKTKVELMRFQEAASKGEFLNTMDEIVTLAEKLTDFIQGVACPKTSDYLKVSIEKGLKVKEEKIERITLEEAKVIALKCTAVFEGAWDSSKNDFNYGVITPNFDLAGLSMGIVQWNIKSKNFFSLLTQMHLKNPAKFKECYEGDNAERFKAYFEIESADSNLKDVWMYSVFVNFIKLNDRKQYFLWARNLHNPDAIFKDKEKWRTKPGLGTARKALRPELIDFFKRLGDVEDFQNVQKKDAWVKYGTKTLEEITWLRNACSKKYPDLLKEIDLKTFCSIFDVCIQQGSFGKIARKKIEVKINNNSFSSQDEIIRMAVIERAKVSGSEWQNNCGSRRLGFLNSKATNCSHLSGKSYTIDNCNYQLLSGTKLIEGV